jgi:uncharacterized protein YecE (DUF72 family)
MSGGKPPSGSSLDRPEPRQPALFDLGAETLGAATQSDELLVLGRALPANVRLGTMSWAFPGWRGLVYDAGAPSSALSSHGLSAYSQHPVLGAVEIDRSYYEPLSADVLARHAAMVPESFRFLVKAHEACVVRRYPEHARYGSRRGELNRAHLDPSYASDVVIGPIAEGLGKKLGAILFQFPPGAAGGEAFPDELAEFLGRLPPGLTYAVELRNARALSTRYVEALAAAGAVHCHNAWSAMPDVLAQARLVPPVARKPLIVRWLLAPGESYEAMRERFAPFARLAREDLAVRGAIARLAARAAAHDVPVLITINNKAEGCAPESAVRLARAIIEAAERAVPGAPLQA